MPAPVYSLKMAKGGKRLVLDVPHQVVGEETATGSGCGSEGDNLQHLAGGGDRDECCTDKYYSQCLVHQGMMCASGAECL